MKKLTRRQFIMRGFFGAAVLAFLDAFWFEKYVIQWNDFDRSKGNKNKIKITQISDLHFKQLRSFHHSIATGVNGIKPDLLVLTGDLVDDNNNLEAFAEFMSLIDKAIPKVAILGNWEYWGNIDLARLEAIYKEHNCQLLINKSLNLKINNRNLGLIGIDDFVGGQANFNQAIQSLGPAETNLVLTHCPQHRETIAKEKGATKIDLVLCGHTHGGQIAFLGWAPLTPRGSGDYVRGWYEDLDVPTYVSKGIGTSVFPFRFGARAEVATFLL